MTTILAALSPYSPTLGRVFLCLLFLLYFLFYLGPRIEGMLRRWAGLSATIPSIGRPSDDRTPYVVVNLPADAVPLATLTNPAPQVVGSDRATLWWTVYSRTLDDSYPETAMDAANQAVEAAYGPAPVPVLPTVSTPSTGPIS